MSHRLPATVLSAALLLHAIPVLTVGQDSSQGTRKVVLRVTPQYPLMARNMNIRGSVKLEALVATNGSVKSVEVKGGHPLLVQSAQNAIREWKFEPTARETREPIEIKFNPE
jgi:TonB family protein